MVKQVACFILSGLAWLVICGGPFLGPAHAQQEDPFRPQGDAEPSCDSTKDAEEERHRGQILELQKEDIEATKDYNNRLLVCKADKQCRDAARKDLDEKRRSIQAKRNEENTQTAKNKLDITHRCQREKRQPQLRSQQPKLDPRIPTTWTDVYGNEQPLSNREAFTTKDGKQFAFPRTIEIGGDIYELDTKSFTSHQTSWGGWNATAYYQNKANPQDRTMRHGLMVK